MSQEVKTLIETLNRDWNEFKEKNDKKISDTAENINSALTKTQEKLEEIETALSRRAIADKAGEVVEMTKSAQGLKKLAQLSKTDSSFKDFITQDGKGKFDTELAVKTVLGQVGVGADGGYGVPTVIDQTVNMMIIESSPIESLADVVTIGQQDGYHGLIDNNDAGAGWITETGTRTQTDANTYTRIDIKAWELYANPRLTLQAIEDVPFGIEGELLNALGLKLSRARAAAFINGAGDSSNQPSGFLNTSVYSTNALASNAPAVNKINTVAGLGTGGTAQTILADDIFNLVYSLRDGYLQNGEFAAHRLIVEQIRKLKDNYGRYMWEPNYAAGEPAKLVGFPIHHFNDMTSTLTVSGGAFALTFAEWKCFYKIVNRIGLQLLRDPYTVEGQVVFKTRQRVGGGIFNGVAGPTLVVAQS